MLAGCAAAGARLIGTVAATAPQTQTLTVRHGTGETMVRVDDATHFWSGTGLEQLRTGDGVSLQVEGVDGGFRARSIEIFPAGRPRTRWTSPGGY